jgi:DNA topoisomerase II
MQPTLVIKPASTLKLSIVPAGQQAQAQAAPQPQQPPKMVTLRVAPAAAQQVQVQPAQVYAGTSNGPSADAYKQYDQRTHVYMKPDMYIGADGRSSREEWLFDSTTGQMVNSVIDFSPGCERIYLEVLTNASDNVGRSRRADVDPGRIDITMNQEMISVTNYGLPIPVEMHPKENVYVPQMIFGSLLTSSNYEVDRHEAGTNGIGAKAANIFSKEFTVLVHDAVRHLKYYQVWSNNMINRSAPAIEPYTGKQSSVQVSYKMDFARFGYPLPSTPGGGYPPEAFALFIRHAIDISFTAKIPVSFNGSEFNFSNIRDYARLYWGEAVDTAIVHYQWPAGTETTNRKKGQQIAKNPSVSADVELIAIDTPDAGSHVSFVNCMMTRDGGVHVDTAIKAVADSAVQMVNDSVLKSMLKQNKGKELTAAEKRSHTITIADVKPHISILLAVRVVNPKFTSQTKTKLHSPTPKIQVAEEELKAITRWKLVDRLYAALEAKQFASMTKTDGKLKRFVRLQSGVDANNAGKTARHQCVLYITEGQSGAGYANALLKLMPGGRDNIGVLPMRGKSLNVMNADRFQIERNNEIGELKKMLGLCEGLDYTKPENFSKMRYGSVMIMADSDMDGKHIIGLILNFFHCRFPSLLARGFILYYRSPTIRVWSGKTVHKFYTQNEYEIWKRETPNYQNWKHKYYKGLGTSKDADVKDDFNTPRVVHCLYDSQAPKAMTLAFDKKYADQRKEWIAGWKQVLGVDDIKMQPISTFINHDLILYSIENVRRSIPRLMDGFKESQRKVLHGMHLKWKISAKGKEYNELKVAQLAAFVAEKCGYHHGEVILSDVVINMAQDFIGSNNIPWLYRSGQFGTRYAGGKDAAAGRYPFTYPEKIVGNILRKEDRPLLNHLIDEGESIEPEEYFPVIPMILVNGAHGIATAWSTTVPSHNPLDIIRWLTMRLNGVEWDKLPDVLPWFRGFTGTIKMIDRQKKIDNKKEKERIRITKIEAYEELERKITQSTVEEVPEDLLDVPAAQLDQPEDDESDQGELFPDEMEARQLLSIVTYGTFKVNNAGTIIVTELPIGTWPQRYRKWLEQLVEDKEITSFRDMSSGNDVYFEINGFKEPGHRSLRLQRSIGMSNMVLLNQNNKPVRYDSSQEILEAFYEIRLPIYQKRKDYIIANLTKEIEGLNNKIKFVRAVVSGELQVMNRPKAEIVLRLDELQIPRALLGTVRITNCTEDEIRDLTAEIEKMNAEMTTMINTTPNQLWLKDLVELEDTYRAMYGIKKPVLNIVPKNPTPPATPNIVLKITPPATPPVVPTLTLKITPPREKAVIMKIVPK